MADVKYPDYTPVDEPVRTGPKPAEPGSGIRVDGKPLPTPKVVKKAAGGSASSRADGCCVKGKTRGKMM